VDDHGRDILIVDRSFKPYFYAISREDSSPDSFSSTLLSSKAAHDDVVDVSVEKKRLFGQVVKCVKITCRLTQTLDARAKLLTKRGLVQQILGNDLRYSSLYLYDRGLIPCRWHESEVEEIKVSNACVDNAHVSLGSPRPVAFDSIPKLRILAFSTIAFAEKGSPHASQDPVSIISIATSDGKVRDFSRSGASDQDILAEFVRCVTEFDPNIVAGYESNTTGWPYLIERARKSNVALTVSRVGSQPHTSVYGHVSIAGRTSLDMLDYTSELPEVKVKSIEKPLFLASSSTRYFQMS